MTYICEHCGQIVGSVYAPKYSAFQKKAAKPRFCKRCNVCVNGVYRSWPVPIAEVCTICGYFKKRNVDWCGRCKQETESIFDFWE